MHSYTGFKQPLPHTSREAADVTCARGNWNPGGRCLPRS